MDLFWMVTVKSLQQLIERRMRERELSSHKGVRVRGRGLCSQEANRGGGKEEEMNLIQLGPTNIHCMHSVY